MKRVYSVIKNITGYFGDMRHRPSGTCRVLLKEDGMGLNSRISLRCLKGWAVKATRCRRLRFTSNGKSGRTISSSTSRNLIRSFWSTCQLQPVCGDSQRVQNTTVKPQLSIDQVNMVTSAGHIARMRGCRGCASYRLVPVMGKS